MLRQSLPPACDKMRSSIIGWKRADRRHAFQILEFASLSDRAASATGLTSCSIYSAAWSTPRFLGMQRLAFSALTLSLLRPFHRNLSTMNGSLSAVRVPTTTEAVHRLTSDEVEARYRPFRTTKNNEGEPDWTESLELDTVQKLAQARSEPVKVLVLYGSLRERYVHITWTLSVFLRRLRKSGRHIRPQPCTFFP
jgi:hypothetical protein